MSVDYDEIYDDKHDKYMDEYRAGAISQWDVEDRARASARREFDFRKNSPQQVAPKPIQAPAIKSQSVRDSIDDNDVANDADAPYQYQDSVDDMFANIGGLGKKDDFEGEEGPARAPVAGAQAPKLGWGSRLWNGIKAGWGAVKNLSGYNLLRHGIGAGFRKSKVAKNERKLDEATTQLDEMRTRAGIDPVRGAALQKQFDSAERKLAYNRKKLGEHRKYRTGREWKNEWSRLFTGRDAKLSQARDRYQHGFDYTLPGAADNASSRSSSSKPVSAPIDVRAPAPAPQVDKPQVLAPAPAPKNDEWNVAQAQQQVGGDDDLQYDANGNVVFDGDLDDDD